MQNSIFTAKKWLSSTAMKLFSSSSDDLDTGEESRNGFKINKVVEDSGAKRGRGRPRKDLNAPNIIKSDSGRSYELRRSSSLRSSKSNMDVPPNDGERRFLLTYKALPKNLQILAKTNYPEAHNMYEEHRTVCRIINDNTPKPKEIFIPTFRRLTKPRNLKDLNRKKDYEDEIVDDDICLQRHRPMELAERRERRREEELIRYELYIKKLSKEYPELLNRKYPITSDGSLKSVEF